MMDRYRVMWNDGVNLGQGQYKDVEADSAEAAAFAAGSVNAGSFDSVTKLVTPPPDAQS
jgi:hypothetical protein